MTKDMPQGMAVLEGPRGRARHRLSGPVNVVTGSCLADMGGSATFQSTWVDVEVRGAAGGVQAFRLVSSLEIL